MFVKIANYLFAFSGFLLFDLDVFLLKLFVLIAVLSGDLLVFLTNQICLGITVLVL